MAAIVHRGSAAPAPARAVFNVFPEQCPEYVTMLGSWGDVLAACGTAQEMLRRTGAQRVRVLYYGYEEGIPEFLQEQPWVSEVRYERPHAEFVREDYLKDLKELSRNDPSYYWGLREHTTFWRAHLDFTEEKHVEVWPWHGAKLPPKVVGWSDDVVAPLRADRRRFYLLQPCSLQSTPWEQHWPHWEAAIEDLLESTDATFVLVGHDYEYTAEHPRLLNLIGKTPSMMHVFALAERLDGVITTSNSLAHWATIQGLPCLVAPNRNDTPESFWGRWLAAGRNRVLPNDAEQSALVYAFAQLRKPKPSSAQPAAFERAMDQGFRSLWVEHPEIADNYRDVEQAARGDVAHEYRQPAAQARTAQKTLLVRAHLDTVTGYGILACGIINGLIERGREVAVIPLNKVWEPWGQSISAAVRNRIMTTGPLVQDRPHFVLAGPQTPAPAGSVQLTMWESGRLPAAANDDRELTAVEYLNRRRALIVPSEWNQSTFDANGVTVPIYKLPLPVVDPGNVKFRRGPRPNEFRIGTSARVAHGGVRKGMDAAVRAFEQAFRPEDNVALEIKVFPDDAVPANLDCSQDRRVVRVIKDCWTREQMEAWYSSLDLYLTMSTAEGFGLQPLEAMACGVPVMGVARTGMAEYLNDRNGYPLEFDIRRAEEVAPGNPHYTGAWYVPRIEDAAEQLREVFKTGVSREKAQAARDTARLFTWPVFLDGLESILTAEGLL